MFDLLIWGNSITLLLFIQCFAIINYINTLQFRGMNKTMREGVFHTSWTIFDLILCVDSDKSRRGIGIVNVNITIYRYLCFGILKKMLT